MSSVSVIVPSYNYAHYLPGCVASVLSQRDVDVEVLVIDDCSGDDTGRVGRELAADPRVTFRRHDVNRGHIATYNEGLAWASADYLVVLSADDMLTPGSLERATDALDSCATAGFAYGRPVYFETDEARPAARTGEARRCVWRGRDWIAQRCKSATSCISSPEVVVRTALQRQVGGYRADLPHAGDLEMWLRFAALGDVVYLRDVDQAYYRRHPQSMMRVAFASKVADLEQRREAFDAVFDHHGRSLAGAEGLRASAHRALAREALWDACRLLDHQGADEAELKALTQFATQTDPQARDLAEYRGLRRRQRIGPRWSPRVQALSISPYAHRLRSALWWRRWREFGV